LADRVKELVIQATAMLQEGSLWRAYVAVESAILDLKLRNNLEGQSPPLSPKRNAKKDDLVAAAKDGLAGLDFSDKKKLLYGLRACRDTLKAAVAKS
jgi:hypothetical protein